ncbi:DUF2637 domain-containing protein [Nocardia noduli]|uniref:DUF2637 domain-containing protein n=1 Tax=Nocardia noduli TaxID=2815722 RepID=UPI001C247FAE|nr:DUF2637 domain-containing protein [Nocardia noduli]
MTDFALTSSTGTVRTVHHGADTPTSRAHGFFWSVLAAAATVSITGNATQALLHDTALPAVAAAVAVIPPLALLAAIHGVTVLARAHTATRATRWVATAMTVLIATGAFWLSFTALRSLAIVAGVPAGEAWLWPVIIEGSMAQATVALLALAHSGHGEKGAHQTDRANGVASPLDEQPTAIRVLAAQTPAVVAGSVHTPTPAADDTGRDFSAEAARLCARDPAKRRDPALVARALTHHHLDGWNPSRIAAELNKSRSTISRILSDAASLHAHDIDEQTVPTTEGTGRTSAAESEFNTPVGTN